MSLEEKEPMDQAPEAPKKEDKPRTRSVVTYILIMFIAAFLLMALSSLMHQRSNTEVLGKLQDSVTAMQEVQANQEKIIELQEQLAAAEEELSAQQKSYEEAIAGKDAAISEQDKVAEAMMDLYRLQQAYSRKDYEECQDMIRHMEASGSISYLPTEVAEDPTVTAPSLRYAQFKEAVIAILTLGD